ncbi:MAG TPA: zf-HC2 domain-containing protein [Acidobacteriaceae bacterium]|nr:zf-HC2 domain-containing protein [Acidobacteriaceae bacterium]
MKCDVAQRSIVQYVYGELPDEGCHDLELHVAGCEPCRNELQVYEALRQALALAPVVEPSASLLAQSRIRLDDALDQMPAPTLRMRLETGVMGFFAQLRAAPGMAVALAALGLGLGATAGHYWNRSSSVQPTGIHSSLSSNWTAVSAPSVANISQIVRHPETHMVEVHFNQVVPSTVEGSMDDPEVQKLLLLAAQNTANPNLRSDSVGLLAEQCKAGQYCQGGPVRTALMVALRYDRDPSVRLKALEGLQPYVAQDSRVRDAILESLMHDPSQPIRNRALQMLEPVNADSSVRIVLQTVSSRDVNPAMREASLKVLHSIPETE